MMLAMSEYSTLPAPPPLPDMESLTDIEEDELCAAMRRADILLARIVQEEREADTIPAPPPEECCD